MTIFILVANYIQITDLIHTGLLADLSQKFKVVVLLPTLDGLSEYPQNPNLVYVQWDIQFPNFWGRSKLLRVGLITAFDRLASVKAHYTRSFGDWRRRWLRRVARLCPWTISPDFFLKWETRLLPTCPDFDHLVTLYQPKAVLVGTPGFTDLEAEMVVLARRAGLPTIALNFSWDNLTTNAKHIRRTDFLLTWNESIYQEALTWHHYSKDKVFVSGPLRFDHYFTEPARPPLEIVAPPLLLITTTSHGVYPHHNYLLSELLKLRAEKKIPWCRILVRVHPKDDIEKYAAFSSEIDFAVELAGTPKPITGGSRHKIELNQTSFSHLRELFSAAAVTINYCSTMTLEALAVGCPAINVIFPNDDGRRHYEYEHYRPIATSGAVRVAGDLSQLTEAICYYLANRSADQDLRRRLVEKFFYRVDGQARQRCAEIVGRIIERLP